MRNRSTKGFTLIELLIVIAIIGILAAVLIPNLLQARTRGVLTAGTNYAREALIAVESMQSSNSTVDYIQSNSRQAFFATDATLIDADTLTLATNTAGVTVDFQINDFLRDPQQGVQQVWLDTTDVANAYIQVEQTIGAADWCTLLRLTANELTQTTGACVALP